MRERTEEFFSIESITGERDARWNDNIVAGKLDF